MGPQVPWKSGQADNVYLSRDTTSILGLSLAPALGFEKSLGFHPGELPELGFPKAATHTQVSFPGVPFSSHLLHLTKLTCFQVRKIWA